MRDLQYGFCRHDRKVNNVREGRSLSGDEENNGIKEVLLEYPELPEYTASLTSLLELILVPEMTRGGTAQLNVVYRENSSMPRMYTHLACSNERPGPAQPIVLTHPKFNKKRGICCMHDTFTAVKTSLTVCHISYVIGGTCWYERSRRCQTEMAQCQTLCGQQSVC